MAVNTNLPLQVQSLDTATPLASLSQGIYEKKARDVAAAKEAEQTAYNRQQDAQKMQLLKENQALDREKVRIAALPEQKKSQLRDMGMFITQLDAAKQDPNLVMSLLEDPHNQKRSEHVLALRDAAAEDINNGDKNMTKFNQVFAVDKAMIEHFGEAMGMNKLLGGGKTAFSQTMAALDSDPSTASMSTVDKIRIAQNKLGTNLTIDASGNVVPMGGTVEATGKLAAGKAAGQETGKAQGAAQAGLGTVLDSANLITNQVDKMLNHPGMSKALGMIDSNTPIMKSTDAAGFKALLDQVNSGAFLDAFEKLRGGGAITEIEGQKATEARSRMSLALNDKEFKDAAKDYLDIVKIGVARAKHKAAGDFSSQDSGASTEQPQTGGVKFLGFE